MTELSNGGIDRIDSNGANLVHLFSTYLVLHITATVTELFIYLLLQLCSRVIC